MRCGANWLHHTSAAAHHDMHLPVPVRPVREVPTRARSMPGYFGHSLWSVWGLLQFASPSASATAAINWLPIAVHHGKLKNSSNGEVLGAYQLEATPMQNHQSPIHHPSHSSITISPHLPSTLMKGKTKEHTKKNKSFSRHVQSRRDCPPSHHVNHSDQSLGPCRPPWLGIHTSSI